MTKERQLLAQAVQQMRMRGGEEEKDKEGLFKANAVKEEEEDAVAAEAVIDGLRLVGVGQMIV